MKRSLYVVQLVLCVVEDWEWCTCLVLLPSHWWHWQQRTTFSVSRQNIMLMQLVWPNNTQSGTMLTLTASKIQTDDLYQYRRKWHQIDWLIKNQKLWRKTCNGKNNDYRKGWQDNIRMHVNEYKRLVTYLKKLWHNHTVEYSLLGMHWLVFFKNLCR